MTRLKSCISRNHNNPLGKIDQDKLFHFITEHLMDNHYENLIRTNNNVMAVTKQKFFKADHHNLSFTVGGNFPEDALTGLVESLRKHGNFDLLTTIIPIGENLKIKIRNRTDVMESLKYTETGGVQKAVIKIPNDKKAEFLRDVVSKFNLKKSTRYGTDFYSAVSSEKNSKYYLTQSVEGTIHACINTKFDSSFHTDMTTFKDYIDSKVDALKPAKEPVAEKEVPAEEKSTSDYFMPETAYNVVDGIKIGEAVGKQVLWEMLASGNKLVNVKDGNGQELKVKIINENKFIVKLVEDSQDNNDNDLENDINDELEIGDQVEVDGEEGPLIMYLIQLANGGFVKVVPEFNAVQLISACVISPEDVETSEVKLEEVKKFVKTDKNNFAAGDKVKDKDGNTGEVVDYDPKEQQGPTKFFGGAVTVKYNKGKKTGTHIEPAIDLVKESKTDLFDEHLKKKGFIKNGNSYVWEKYGSSLEGYRAVINKSDKNYHFEYNSVLNELNEQSEDFSFDVAEDIVLPTTMEEFDHIMKLKQDKLFKRNSIVEVKIDGKFEKAKIKRYNFGTYVVEVNKEEYEVKAGDIKELTQEK